MRKIFKKSKTNVDLLINGEKVIIEIDNLGLPEKFLHKVQKVGAIVDYCKIILFEKGEVFKNREVYPPTDETVLKSVYLTLKEATKNGPPNQTLDIVLNQFMLIFEKRLRL